MYMLKKCKSLIPNDILTTIYNAIILPHLDYCNVVWGNCGTTVANRLQIIQNRAARIICGVAWDTPSQEVLNHLGWQRLYHRQNYNCSLLVYKILNDLAPPYLSGIFHFLAITTISVTAHTMLQFLNPEQTTRSVVYLTEVQ